MGRRNQLVKGAVFGDYRLVEDAPASKGPNRMCIVECTSCGARKTLWNTALYAGRVSCDQCSKTHHIHSLVITGKAPILAVFPGSVSMIMDGQPIPHGVPLFQFIDGSTALPYTAAPKGPPKPSEAFLTHLKVPAEYLDWLVAQDGVSVSDVVAAAAGQWYEDNVEVIDPVIPPRYSVSSRATWMEGETMYAYLYWQNAVTWPKGKEMPEELRPVPKIVRASTTFIRPSEAVKAVESSNMSDDTVQARLAVKDAEEALFKLRRSEADRVNADPTAVFNHDLVGAAEGRVAEAKKKLEALV